MIYSRNFYPTFWTQFLGAFNDNVFKNALVILITYKSFSLGSIGPKEMVALCSALFILPFFLFSSLAGQLSDKFRKDRLIKIIKFIEILIMSLAAYGLLNENLNILIISLFLMGAQSSFFGPAKYSIIPELVSSEQLTEANGLFSMGTFVSILLGTIVGGILISLNSFSNELTALTVVSMAILGFFMSLRIKSNLCNPNLKINYNIISTSYRLFEIVKKNKATYSSVIGISWYWLIGAVLLSIFPVFSKNEINGDESVTTFFLALFSIGVAAGSIICSKLSKSSVEYGTIIVGSMGISISSIVVFFLPSTLFISAANITTFLSDFNGLILSFTLFCISLFSGFFIVPLYTILQRDSEPSERSRVIAANNILNAFFMVIGSLGLGLLYKIGLDSREIFLIIGIANLFAFYKFYRKYSIYFWRLCCELASRFFYKFTFEGEIEVEAPYIIIANHVSFIDWMFMAAAIRQPPRFVMWYVFFKMPIINIFFKGADAIPIAGFKENRKIMNQAFKDVDKSIKAGFPIAYFPEGVITKNGEMDDFRPGLEKIINENNVKIIPMYVDGLWGSFFSRFNGSACSSFKLLLKEFKRPVHVTIGESFDYTTLDEARKRVEALIG